MAVLPFRLSVLVRALASLARFERACVHIAVAELSHNDRGPHVRAS
jgi:hypothetical protein